MRVKHQKKKEKWMRMECEVPFCVLGPEEILGACNTWKIPTLTRRH